MSWKIESEHVDLAEMEHVTVFVAPSVKTRSGEPARHLLQIRLGEPGGLALGPRGELVDAEGKLWDHKAKQEQVLTELNDLHARARAFAQRHGVPIYRGPQG